ncbi:MAG TPA: MotA/TolQ/ExbB proton channel family protein [Gammaproteobacteria bacterium]|nr:MotA/TolQ/ExbB proton channel family protein [Gammaproteobacteria bacterium]
MDIIYAIVKFFVAGGIIMYPIMFVAAVGAAIGVERYITLRRVTAKNRSMWSKLEPLLARAEFDKAREITAKDDSTISQLLNMGLARQGAVRRRDDIEIAMEETMMEIIPHLEKRTSYIALAANVSTLLGLLGTIMGLIQAFTAVSNANPAEKADLLAAAISVAMNATAFGLLVAIPMLVTHTVLTQKTAQIVAALEMASVKTLNAIMTTAKRQYQVAA